MKRDASDGPTSADIREVERLWIPYRDAWKQFGSVHYSQTKADLWLTWVTTERIDQLQEIFDEYGDTAAP
jgi:hypothetical protein